jgi:putative SbcD/Mre11-related phosphoesterase
MRVEGSGWWMTPEGGLLHERERVAVVADVHLGYDWARARGGDVVPPHALAETIAAVGSMLDRGQVDRLIVAGDLVESWPCTRTARDVATLREWLAGRGVGLELVAGNHDRGSGAASIDVDGWTIAHGHRPIDAARLIVGHWHPVARLAGVTARCFVVSADRVVLPAFSSNAAGVEVVGACPEGLAGAGARCIVSTGEGLLDFGPLGSLARRGGNRTAPAAGPGRARS